MSWHTMLARHGFDFGEQVMWPGPNICPPLLFAVLTPQPSVEHFVPFWVF